MGRKTVAGIENKLARARDRYREHQERGDDMLEAGEELIRTVDQVLEGPVCGLPRSEILRERQGPPQGEPK